MPSSSLKISRVLHAGYVYETNKTRIIFDPIFENPFSRNCFAYPDVEFDHSQIKKLKLDAIFISHYHDDHFSLESLQYLDRSTPVYLYCIHEELFAILREFGFSKVFPMRTDEAVKVKDFEVIPRLALDADVDSIFHIKAEGFNILNVVDAWIDPKAMSKLKENSWDVILWPFQTMREVEVIAPSLAKPAELPPEWIEQLKELNPRYVVPSSCQFIQEEWSWYRKAYFPISYERFQKEVEFALPNSKVKRLNPGVSIELNGALLKDSAALPWILARGNQDVDYEYDPKIIPAETKIIAKSFTPLSDLEKQRVLNFCEKEMVEKYNKMESSLTGQWKLVLYDHLGEPTLFCYEINDGIMKRAQGIDFNSWTTEVPISKVHAALQQGESLTTMYLRMEGMLFEDIGQDPLIASLFNDDVGAYQKAQLKTMVALG